MYITKRIPLILDGDIITADRIIEARRLVTLVRHMSKVLEDLGMPPILEIPQDLGMASDVLEAVDCQSDTPWIGARDEAVVTLLYGCGLRISELANLPLREVSLEEGAVRVRGKGRKERLTVLGDPARDALRAYLASRQA